MEERCALLAGLEREYPALYDIDVATALKGSGSILWKNIRFTSICRIADAMGCVTHAPELSGASPWTILNRGVCCSSDAAPAQGYLSGDAAEKPGAADGTRSRCAAQRRILAGGRS